MVSMESVCIVYVSFYDYHLLDNIQDRVFMTHATKAICHWLLSDFIKVKSVEIFSISPKSI